MLKKRKPSHYRVTWLFYRAYSIEVESFDNPQVNLFNTTTIGGMISKGILNETFGQNETIQIIEINNLVTGVYFLKIISEHAIQTTKVIVKK